VQTRKIAGPGMESPSAKGEATPRKSQCLGTGLTTDDAGIDFAHRRTFARYARF
jgi:hypothetical protein